MSAKRPPRPTVTAAPPTAPGTAATNVRPRPPSATIVHAASVTATGGSQRPKLSLEEQQQLREMRLQEAIRKQQAEQAAEQPQEPSAAEQPKEPQEPSAAEQPKEPKEPSAAEQPKEPSATEQPQEPAATEQPKEPSAATEQPQEPSAATEQPKEPKEPSATEQPKEPLAAEQPKEPSAAEQPKGPVAAEQPKGPVAAEQPADQQKKQLVGQQPHVPVHPPWQAQHVPSYQPTTDLPFVYYAGYNNNTNDNFDQLSPNNYDDLLLHSPESEEQEIEDDDSHRVFWTRNGDEFYDSSNVDPLFGADPEHGMIILTDPDYQLTVEEMSVLRDTWIPASRDCECCHGYVYTCEGQECDDLGACYCVAYNIMTNRRDAFNSAT